jgi:hypothetical protein
MIFATLPQTATREATNSEWAYMALPGRDDGGNPIWSVTVLEFRGVRKTRRVIDRYMLEPEPAKYGRGVAFLVSKVHHSGDEDTVRGRQAGKRVGEVYHCEVGPGYHRCTCTGGATEGHRPGGTCVHVYAVRDMVEQGDLLPDAPHPLDRPAQTGEDASPAPGERGEPTEDDLRWLREPAVAPAW